MNESNAFVGCTEFDTNQSTWASVGNIGPWAIFMLIFYILKHIYLFFFFVIGEKFF